MVEVLLAFSLILICLRDRIKFDWCRAGVMTDMNCFLMVEERGVVGWVASVPFLLELWDDNGSEANI